MRSRPIPLLSFDAVGAEQLHWDDPPRALTYDAPIEHPFVCRAPRLHRIDVFVDPGIHPCRSQLWLLLFDDDGARTAARPAPLRVVGPLLTESLTSRGWFGFEFPAVEQSADRRFRILLLSPDGLPGNALLVRSSQLHGLTFRATCVRAPALFDAFRRHRDALSSRTDQVTAPLMLRAEISRVCNLRCVMCHRGLQPFDARKDGTGFMSLRTFQSVDAVLPTLLRVIGFGLGEPFLNPEYLDILRHLRAHNAFAHVFASTNGTCLTDATIDALGEEHLLSELQVSLDGNVAASFESIRGKASFATVLGSIKRLVTARDRRSRPGLSVTAAMLVMKPNRDEVLGFVERMRELGVDRISLDSPKDAQFAPLRADRDDDMAAILQQLAIASELLEGSDTTLTGPLLNEVLAWHERTGRTGSLPRLGPDECAIRKDSRLTSPSPCSVPWQSFTLAADGAVHVCCNSIRRMGHVGGATIDSIWSDGDGYRALRRELLTRQLHRDCRSCLGENFVVPSEMMPISYTLGCIAESGQAQLLADQVASPVLASATPGRPDLRARVDTLRAIAGEAAGWRVAGSVICANKPVNPSEPLILGLTVRGVVRGYAGVCWTSGDCGEWSITLPAGGPPPRITDLRLLVVGSGPWVDVPFARHPSEVTTVSASLHGFVDELIVDRDRIVFRGWARNRTTGSPAAEIVVVGDRQLLVRARLILPRLDVRDAYASKELLFGYVAEAPLSLLQRAGRGAVTVFATDASGRAELEWSPTARAVCESLVPRPARSWWRRAA